jgi:Bacterial protein of unknown function (DUF894).
MLIGGIVLGLVLGLIVGGRITNLASIRLHRLGLLVAAVILRFGTEYLLNAGVAPVETLRVPLLASAFGLLLIALWANRGYPGMSLAFIGILSNAFVMVVNRGDMPIYGPSLAAAGLTPADVTSAIHTILPADLDANFLLHLGPFADVIPIPFPVVQNVASIGDLFLTLGLAFFLFAGVVRIPQVLDEEQLAAIRHRLADMTASTRPLRAGDAGAETGLSSALTGAVALERPLVMGSAGPGLSSPSLSMFEADAAAPGRVAIPIPRPSAEAVERVRHHPYVRLALNGSFSALWAGQLISLFGDRLNQLALVAVVAISTGSALATGLVFFAATLPNLLLSPIAGTFVDRWDHKEVMVVSDILRAAIVLILRSPVTNIILVYPLIFLVTSISVFFRPARVAILPRIVQRRICSVRTRPCGSARRSPMSSATRFPASSWCFSGAPSRWRSGWTVRRTSPRPRCSGRSSSTRRHDPMRPGPGNARDSSRSSPPAGTSCGARRSCWRTPSRAQSASSASASPLP